MIIIIMIIIIIIIISFSYSYSNHVFSFEISGNRRPTGNSAYFLDRRTKNENKVAAIWLARKDT